MSRMATIVAPFSSLVLVLALFCMGANGSSSNGSTAKTAAKGAAKNYVAKTATNSSAKHQHVLASAEDLSGTISAIDPSDKEVTLVGSNGVPYDFDLTPRTQVELSNQKLALNKLADESHKQATVHFVPTSQGNMAQTIRITS